MSDPWKCTTVEEWYEIVNQFRDGMQSRAVMADSKRRDGLVKGFGVAFLRLELPEADMDAARTLFESHMDEFTRREIYAQVDPRNTDE